MDVRKKVQYARFLTLAMQWEKIHLKSALMGGKTDKHVIRKRKPIEVRSTHKEVRKFPEGFYFAKVVVLRKQMDVEVGVKRTSDNTLKLGLLRELEASAPYVHPKKLGGYTVSGFPCQR